GATASTPLTIALWIGVFAAATVASHDRSGPTVVLLVAGVGLGSMACFTILSSVVARARRRLGPRLLRAVDLGSGAGLTAFGAVLGYRAPRGRRTKPRRPRSRTPRTRR